MERATRQRAAIRHTLEAASRPLLPQEVLEGARAQVPGLGIATVYRCLKQLVAERALQVVELPGENARYERIDVGHHHHFQCRGCDRVFDVHACPGDFGRLAPAGFSVEDHELTLYGRCGECQPRPPAAPRRRAGAQPK
jgi:Fur family transcriptional regulator, ferric uptake regulator